MTFPFRKMGLVHVVVIWYPLNELTNPILYFFKNFLKVYLFRFFILWDFGYVLAKVFNIKILSCLAIIWPYWLFTRELLYLLLKHVIEFWSIWNSSKSNCGTYCLSLERVNLIKVLKYYKLPWECQKFEK